MENSFSINSLKGDSSSDFFRKKLIELGYHKFDGKPIKGQICYDAYYKDFIRESGLKYTIYCYCYDLKEITDKPELFEFSFETQVNTEMGIVGLESIQWDFRTEESCINNILFLEKKLETIWKCLGEINFPD